MLKDLYLFQRYNITMFAFLRATQKLGLMAGPETRLSVRMLSRTAPAGNEAMPLPTHDKVELISIDREVTTTTMYSGLSREDRHHC